MHCISEPNSGKKKIEDRHGNVWNYEGELNFDFKACGYGIAINNHDPEYRYEGSFFEDTWEGICSNYFDNYRLEGEFKEG